MRSCTLVLAILVGALPGTAAGQRLIAPADRRSAPSFDLEQVDGPTRFQAPSVPGRLTSRGLAGSIVVLDLWAVGCVPCGPSHEALVEAGPLLQDSGVVILSVGSPENAATVRAWVAEHGGPAYPVVLMNQALWDSLEVSGWPRMVIIDAQGRIAYDGFAHAPSAFLPRVLPQLQAERDGRPPPRDPNRLN